MKKISVVLIVKDEEAILGRCLESVKDADEIIVFDTGSTDGTRAVAMAYPNVSFVEGYAWRDDFSDARNSAKLMATGDWILSIDADEYLDAGGIDKARQVIESTPNSVLSVVMQNEGSESRYYNAKLFRNTPTTYWVGAIHEVLNKIAEARTDIVTIRGYSPRHKSDPDYALRILEREVKAHPNASRETFYLAREYVYRGRWAEASGLYALYLSRKSWLPERAEAFYELARCYWFMQRGDEAREACGRAIAINPDFKNALYLMARMHYEPNKSKWARIADAAQDTDVLFGMGKAWAE